jgi:hypothetical protein
MTPPGWKWSEPGSKPNDSVQDPIGTSDYKRRLAKAQALMAAERYEDAAEVIFNFKGEEMFLRGSLRLYLEVLIKLADYEKGHPFAQTLLAGNQEDRRLAGIWYVECAAARKQAGDVAGAANLLSEGVSKLPEYQNAFAAEPRIKGLISPKK